jgi:putative hydrolase of the HAD superfamily
MKIYDSTKFKSLPGVFLFDTDNTLYAYDRPHKIGMAAVKAKVVSMFSISDSDFDKSFALAREDVKKRLSGSAASHSRLLYMQRMLEILGLGSQILLALDLEQTYWRTFLGQAVLFDEVKELLDDIRILGIPAVVVTDLTAQIQFRKLVYFGLENSFDFVVTSEEAGFDKPHGAPFKMALEKARVDHGDVWMIGDNPINDISGARDMVAAVTLQKIHKGIDLGLDKLAPDASFENFAELRKIISKLGHSE